MADREVVWCCKQCGRTGKTRAAVGDESCYLHAMQVYADSIQRDPRGMVIKADAVEYHPPGPGKALRK